MAVVDASLIDAGLSEQLAQLAQRRLVLCSALATPDSRAEVLEKPFAAGALAVRLAELLPARP